MKPQSKKAIVTAGASGIGLAIAKELIRQDFLVSIIDISKEQVRQVCEIHANLFGFTADIGNYQEVEKSFGAAIEKMGGVDLLVNNAGIGGPRNKVEDISYADWNDCIRINLSGMFYCCKQVIPIMKKQKQGSIVNISTSSALTGLPSRLPYVASKVGVLGLSKNLARELGPHGIRCNTILPGLIDNERGRMLVKKFADQTSISESEAEKEFLRYISLRTWIKPEDIAKAVVFLVSDSAKCITDQEINVDGNAEWEQ